FDVRRVRAGHPVAGQAGGQHRAGVVDVHGPGVVVGDHEGACAGDALDCHVVLHQVAHHLVRRAGGVAVAIDGAAVDAVEPGDRHVADAGVVQFGPDDHGMPAGRAVHDHHVLPAILRQGLFI